MSEVMSDLIGGDRKKMTEASLEKVHKKMKDVYERIFSNAPTRNMLCQNMADQGLLAEVANGDYAAVSNQAKQKLMFLIELRELLAKAAGAYVDTEDLKVDLADKIETTYDRIKNTLAASQHPLGTDNDHLAREIQSRLKILMKDYGDGGEVSNNSLLKSYEQSTKQISQVLSSLANKMATGPSHRPVNRLRL